MQILNLRGNAIAVSGRGARDFSIGAEMHPHLIDANDGWSSRENLQAAAIAPNAEQADAVATALAVMPAQAGIDLVETLPGFAAQIIDAQGGVHSCSAWSTFVAADQAGAAPAVASAGAWPQNYAVSVSFEVPRVADTTKPFIAIWITDTQRNVVRTLLVIGDHARWRESNYVFWRRVERMDLAGIASIARPSRAPGRYSVAWDGLDNAGRAVGQGQYTLNIEASREHGSHSVQTIPLTLGAAPAQGDAAAQGELGAVQVRYGAPS
jgi:thiamine biosynthesis lipoprotein